MRFVFGAWALSRAFVLLVISLSVPHPIEALANWDGAWYRSIVIDGYSFAADGHQHNVAFFPLFSLVVWPLLKIGLAWPIAGALVANFSFLGALAAIHALAVHCFDKISARWCVATAALLAPSLFSSLTYPQSLYMLFSGCALLLVLRGRSIAGGLLGALASATSGLGIALAVALVVDAVVRRRGVAAVIGGVVAFTGVACFAAFCWLRFGDPLAFLHAQAAWRHGWGLDGAAWVSILRSLRTVEGLRHNVMSLLVPLGAVAIVWYRRQLGPTMVAYGLIALAVLLFSGTPFSVDRNAYAVLPVLLAIGAALRRLPFAGYAVLALSAALLAVDASAFARFEWVS